MNAAVSQIIAAIIRTDNDFVRKTGKIMKNSYIALDLEMTGLNPKLDKIIEIGAVKVMEGKIEDTFEAFVEPGRQLPEEVIRLTGITNEMLKTARAPKEICPHLYKFLDGFVLLGHGLRFDYSFLKKYAINLDIEYEAEGIDTLARKLLTGVESNRLSDLCVHFGIEHRAHRALSDALAAHELYQRFLKGFFSEENKSLFEPVKLNYSVKKEWPATKPQMEHLQTLLDYHNLRSEYEIASMTKNEISRYTDQIILRYGRMKNK